MGQIQFAPGGVIEFGFGEIEFAGFGEVSLAVAEAQVAGRIGSVAKLELPAKVEEQVLAGGNGSQRLGRSGLRIAGHEGGGARPGGTRH